MLFWGKSIDGKSHAAPCITLKENDKLENRKFSSSDMVYRLRFTNFYTDFVQDGFNGFHLQNETKTTL